VDALAGSVIGQRYRLEAKLGEGGMGVVYSAFQVDLGRHVAIKLLTHVSAASMARFELEAHAAASLGNPHIVQVFDFRAAHGDEPAFLVMELLHGPSLRDLVKTQGPLSSERAARLFVQIAFALDAAHRAGIVHRDMKPGNVVITSTPTLGEIAKVLDFGIAKLTSPEAPPLTTDGDIVGTMAYMSPEQAGGGHVDARSDLYSLGATLFFALSGARPVDARTADELFLGIIEGRTRDLRSLRADVDPRLGSIVARALALAPTDRFASAAEMGDALRTWLDARSVLSVPPIPPSLPLAAPVALSSKGKGLGLALVLGLLLVLGAVFVSAAVGGYYFFVMPDPIATTSPVASSAPASTGQGPLAPTSNPSSVPASTAAARTATRGTIPTLPGSVAPSTSATQPSTAGKTCVTANDCGTGSWSCIGDKCTCPQTMCGSICTNISLDGANCGACGKGCSGGDICMAGSCSACKPPMRQMCGGVCLFIVSDNNNCGGCGIKCPVGKICSQGVCPK
jgi:serine/threonine protein kinase